MNPLEVLQLEHLKRCGIDPSHFVSHSRLQDFSNQLSLALWPQAPNSLDYDKKREWLGSQIQKIIEDVQRQSLLSRYEDPLTYYNFIADPWRHCIRGVERIASLTSFRDSMPIGVGTLPSRDILSAVWIRPDERLFFRKKRTAAILISYPMLEFIHTASVAFAGLIHGIQDDSFAYLDRYPVEMNDNNVDYLQDVGEVVNQVFSSDPQPHAMASIGRGQGFDYVPNDPMRICPVIQVAREYWVHFLDASRPLEFFPVWMLACGLQELDRKDDPKPQPFFPRHGRLSHLLHAGRMIGNTAIAFVIAHEMSHVLRGHLREERARTSTIVLGGMELHIGEDDIQELEADALGMSILSDAYSKDDDEEAGRTVPNGDRLSIEYASIGAVVVLSSVIGWLKLGHGLKLEKRDSEDLIRQCDMRRRFIIQSITDLVVKMPDVPPGRHLATRNRLEMWKSGIDAVFDGIKRGREKDQMQKGS